MFIVELWPGEAKGLELLRHSFGTLFSKPRLGFVTVFVTAVVFDASEFVEGAFSPFFFGFTSRLCDFVGSLVEEVGSTPVDSAPPFFSALVLLNHAESSLVQFFQLASRS